MIKVKRALISVSDKTGLVEFARGLQALGIEILSTGGTAKSLKDVGLKVIDVAEYTGFPEMLDGRVKTLHPKIHAGLLALRDNPDHMQKVVDYNISLIDMVVVNLYPFDKVSQKSNVKLDEAIEQIDIGGPSMLRSAAKNFKSVAVVCNPRRYEEVLKELTSNSGILPDRLLNSLAVDVFQLTASYDAMIAGFLQQRFYEGGLSKFPRDLNLSFRKVQDLRYGENPHQQAAFYADRHTTSGLAKIKQLHGKELSFNNILDLNAAVDFVMPFKNPAAVIIKHNNPTGIAEDETLDKAFKNALSADPVSAFGGIIGLNKKIDEKTAVLIAKSGFMECIIAPGFSAKALAILTQKKNIRLIELDPKDLTANPFDVKRVHGGLLVQDTDAVAINPAEWKVVTKKKPTSAQMASMQFGWQVIKYVKSNAIILVKGPKTVGIGCGQTSRIDSAHIAIERAGKNAVNSVLISDAFIPKTDNIEVAAKAGIKAVIQTGGSIADEDVIKAADKAGIAMVFTGVRHFKH